VTYIDGSQESLPRDCLDTALDCVVEGLSHFLGKHTLGENGSVIVNGAFELSSGVFNRLHSKEWLNFQDITATQQLIETLLEPGDICRGATGLNHWRLQCST